MGSKGRDWKVINETRQVEIAGRIEAATSFLSRGRGLLGRPGLPVGGGLWIRPCRAIHMCGMRFALDLIFLSRDLRVTRIYEEVQPQPFWALWRNWGGGRRAYSVLELPVGTLRRTGTQPGDCVGVEMLWPLT